MKTSFTPSALAKACTAVFAGSLLALAGCSQQTAPAKDAASSAASAAPAASSASAAATATGKRLVLAIRGEPDQGFDPIKGWGHYGNPLFQSTLLKRDDKLNLQGDLATKWELSQDAKTWTVTIRDDVKFSDGQPLTADDVVFTYEQGAKAAGTVDMGEFESIKAINPTTLEIKLKKPHITFVNTLVTLGIVPKHAYKEGYADNPMGSGPFKFVSWSKGQQMIVEPNPHYYGNKSEFERITFL